MAMRYRQTVSRRRTLLEPSREEKMRFDEYIARRQYRRLQEEHPETIHIPYESVILFSDIGVAYMKDGKRQEVRF